MKCPYCGKITVDYQSQCIYCGRPLPASGRKKARIFNGTIVKIVLLISASLAVVLLLLIFNPFKGIFPSKKDGPGAAASATTQTPSAAATTSGAGSSTQTLAAEENQGATTPSGSVSAGTGASTGNSSKPAKEEAPPVAAEEKPASASTGAGTGTAVPPSAVSNLSPDKIRQIMNTAGSGVIYSVCIEDLTSGDYVGVNENDAVSSSVMIDIPILYTAAYMIDQNKLSLSTSIRFKYSVGGRGTYKKSDDGRKIPLEDLLREMLQYSDNNATNTLLDYFGMSEIEDVCHSDGYYSVDINNFILKTDDNTSNDNYISARDLCGMVYSIYSGRFQSIGKDFLYKNMRLKDNTASSGLCNGIDCSYYNLNGVKNVKYNEIAIIDNGSTPYVIAYLTNNVEMDDLQDVASTLGKYVHQRVDSIK